MKNYSSKDDFYKKIYLILLLLTLLLSVLSVILASLSDFLIGYKCGARFLQWIDKDIKDGNILIFYKTSIIGSKMITAYYKHLYPYFALFMGMTVVLYGNNCKDNINYDNLYKDSIIYFGSGFSILKVMLTLTPIFYFLLYSSLWSRFFRQYSWLSSTTEGVLLFNLITVSLLSLTLSFCVLSIHSYLRSIFEGYN